jgi:hypothetical protein
MGLKSNTPMKTKMKPAMKLSQKQVESSTVHYANINQNFVEQSTQIHIVFVFATVQHDK